ncbi:P-loop containing nucleoside triphosphate hydrolase protein [Abortiporus biennis]|nr:P-loop containing nucleoside triphosphate hydrolase protein [Abortiporus biennis]
MNNERQKSLYQKLNAKVLSKGGLTVAIFDVSRFLACLALVGLSVFSILNPEETSSNGLEIDSRMSNSLLCGIYVYTSTLALVSLIANRKWCEIVVRHITLVLFASFAVFAYRDVWPLATYTITPMDDPEGGLLWIKIALLAYSSVIIPLFAPKRGELADQQESSVKGGEGTASWFSLMSYSFLDGLVYKAYHTSKLNSDDLPPLVERARTRNLVQRGYKYLDPLLLSKKQHILKGIIFRVFLIDHIEMSLSLLLYVVFSFAGPLSINRILHYIESGGEDALVRPWVWVLWLFIGPLLASVINQWFYFAFVRAVVESQSLLTQLIFDHALRIRVKAEVQGGKSSGGPDKKADGKGANFIGRINNLITTDLSACMNGRNLVILVVSIPFQLVASIAALYAILGWSVFPGVAVMFTLIPLPGFLTKRMRGFQVKKMKKSDARVQVVTETMNVIRMIKLFGWEKKTSDQIAEKRDEELKYIRILKILQCLMKTLNTFIPIVTMVVTYITYTVVMKKELTASIVFPSMAIFDMVQNQFSQIFVLIPQLITSKVSFDRINDFLNETELLDEYTQEQKPSLSTVRDPEFDPETIGIRSASFTWTAAGEILEASTSSDSPSLGHRNFVLRIEDELLFQRGCVNLVIGQTGCGKTSLLMALLGEMHYIPTGPDSYVNLPRSKGVAYHAQESWVLNDTIKNNILFGSPYEEERYNAVIEQCALQRDLELFAAGDETEVGEKGITLSGGQKARVTLARAVYSTAEILLLDDVLAALDVHTAKWIVEKCLHGGLVKGRTVILVTHNVALASPIADFVVCLGPDGRVLSKGTLSSALAKDKKLSAEVIKENDIIKIADQQIDERKPEDVPKKDSTGKLVVAEEKGIGHVGWDALKLFLANMGGSSGLFIFYFSFLATTALSKVSNTLEFWTLSIWARQYEKHDSSQVSVSFYLSIYVCFVMGAFVAYLIGFTIYTFGSIRASQRIHRTLLDSILGTAFSWLDKTPTSRIITRCTQDIQTIDSTVSGTLYVLIDFSLQMLAKFLAIIAVSPIFTFPGVVLAAAGGFVGNIFMQAQLLVKREGAVAKAPLIGHFGAAISGLVSIRAYGAQHAFRQESYKRVDRHARARRMILFLNRWVVIRTDALSALFTASLAAFLIYGSNVGASNIGFSLNMAVGFSGLLLMWVRHFNMFEVTGKYLERIQQYLASDQEPKPTSKGVPPAYWPASGDLRVEHLSARYSVDGPEVLHDISFDVKSGERIGIVGRTGSGKSSLTLAILRCIVTEGSIYYDGIRTSDINLDALRSNITIIPQSPELLSGTLRQNLDPFGQHDDAVLNDALRSAGLFSLQSDNDRNNLTLDTLISGGGSNLSVGQRQIIALARAIVRQSKLLILDEATSAIDYDTDSIIQASLRRELGKDVTVLTIAHRLQSIMDADKIMVLDAGQIVEFDDPKELLKNDASAFRRLVDESNNEG